MGLFRGGEKEEIQHWQGVKETHNFMLWEKLIIFEDFRPNGLQIRIQRIILHRIAPVKIDFYDFGDLSYLLLPFPSLKP